MLVLTTLGAPERRLLRGPPGPELTEAEPSPVPTSRATVIAARALPQAAATSAPGSRRCAPTRTRAGASWTRPSRCSTARCTPTAPPAPTHARAT